MKLSKKYQDLLEATSGGADAPHHGRVSNGTQATPPRPR
jgi:hypothetical protein